jgi:protein-disulfide isomerase
MGCVDNRNLSEKWREAGKWPTLCLSACLVAAGVALVGQAKAQISTPLEQERIEQIIHDYLLAHPEVVIESLRTADAKEKQKQEAAGHAAIAAKRQELLEDPATPAGGNPKGDVTLVEFFDYRCPYCKQVEPTIEALLKQDPNLRIVYKEWPILGPPSVFAAHVAFAAFKQGKYERFHNAMMAAKGEITEEVILKVAAGASLDIARIKIDMAAPEIDQAIKRNYDLADALAIHGTPGFVIGDSLIPGVVDIETLKQKINAAHAAR